MGWSFTPGKELVAGPPHPCAGEVVLAVLEGALEPIKPLTFCGRASLGQLLAQQQLVVALVLIELGPLVEAPGPAQKLPPLR